jgi:hypothetical protein
MLQKVSTNQKQWTIGGENYPGYLSYPSNTRVTQVIPKLPK